MYVLSYPKPPPAPSQPTHVPPHFAPYVELLCRTPGTMGMAIVVAPSAMARAIVRAIVGTIVSTMLAEAAARLEPVEKIACPKRFG